MVAASFSEINPEDKISLCEPSDIEETFSSTSSDTTRIEKAMLEELDKRKVNKVYEMSTAITKV